MPSLTNILQSLKKSHIKGYVRTFAASRSLRGRVGGHGADSAAGSVQFTSIFSEKLRAGTPAIFTRQSKGGGSLRRNLHEMRIVAAVVALSRNKVSISMYISSYPEPEPVMESHIPPTVSVIQPHQPLTLSPSDPSSSAACSSTLFPPPSVGCAAGCVPVLDGVAGLVGRFGSSSAIASEEEALGFVGRVG